ncbi:MAG: GIY-YIG nuclease family protein [Methanomicrobiales archaeon]|nr:GIY-YIG nuclease family protein [Methanomicrobiales archaeon]
MRKGIYCLIFRNRACRIAIGALGEREFEPGWHCYTGSARGPGGLLRVARHTGLKKRGGPRHWHVDHLLLNPAFTLVRTVCAVTGEDQECTLAGMLPGTRVPGVGSSDCHCGSHLIHSPADPTDDVQAIFRELGLSPVITTIKSTKNQ